MRISSPTSKTKLRLRLALTDAIWAALAPFFALALRDPNLLSLAAFPASVPEPYLYALVSIACALASFLFFRLNDSMSRFFSAHDALVVCSAVACAVAASSLALFTFTRLEGIPRSTPVIYALVLGGGLIFTRTAARFLYRAFRASRDTGEAPVTVPDFRRILLIGVDRFAAVAIKLMDCQKPRTTQVVAALDERPSTVGRKIAGVKIVGRSQDIEAVVDEYAVHGVDIHEVWLSDDVDLGQDALQRIRAFCEAREIPCRRISEALNLAPQPARAAAVSHENADGPLHDYFDLKRAIDIVAASGLMVALAPLAVIVAGLTLFDVGAPVLFWQQRVGRNGRKFLLYKFRTYHAPFDTDGRPVPVANRLSAIGRGVRASRLDEIPQLYNVLIGDMSLIGPRPLLPHDQPRDPRLRLRVRPGVTGWAQINGGTIISPEEKDALDNWYIRNASLALDLKIVVQTALIALTGEKLNRRAVEEALSLRQPDRDAPQAAE